MTKITIELNGSEREIEKALEKLDDIIDWQYARDETLEANELEALKNTLSDVLWYWDDDFEWKTLEELQNMVDRDLFENYNK